MEPICTLEPRLQHFSIIAVADFLLLLINFAEFWCAVPNGCKEFPFERFWPLLCCSVGQECDLSRYTVTCALSLANSIISDTWDALYPQHETGADVCELFQGSAWHSIGLLISSKPRSNAFTIVATSSTPMETRTCEDGRHRSLANVINWPATLTFPILTSLIDATHQRIEVSIWVFRS
jgi:hypothetical protein